VAQWFDYAPYGSVLATTNTGATKAGRQYIGQFTDDSGLSYLNARYFKSGQGQFITQDTVFLGDPKAQNLQDPQSLNTGRTTGGLNSAFASGWNGNTPSRGNSTFSSAEYLRDPQTQNSFSCARANAGAAVPHRGFCGQASILIGFA
jgi:RHS repeat-associated protein